MALLEAKADGNSTDKVRRIAIGAYRCHKSLIEERGWISLRWGEAAMLWTESHAKLASHAMPVVVWNE